MKLFFPRSLLVVALYCSTLPARADTSIAPGPVGGQNPTAATRPAPSWTRQQELAKQVAHVLNRLAFGPRPGDAEAVSRMGTRAWIEAQLKPASIDDTQVENESARNYKTLGMTPDQLMLAYTGDSMNILKKVRQDKQEQARRAKAAAAAAKAAPTAGATGTGEMMPAPGVNPAPTTPAAPAMAPLPRRAEMIMAQMKAENIAFGTSNQAVGELVSDKLLRAIDSKRQLQEVLVDFWSNHFNEDVKKGPVAALKIADERNVIRPNLLGTFRQLLGASAKSPAMLWYLDNAKSTLETTRLNGKKFGGINENYAREIMELHTLGVDGGYAQADVQEVARCFTGWGLTPQTGDFRFTPREHDNGEKTVLGVRIPAGGGEQDGEMVLDILARHPSTAKFLATKLCRRFVADEPPASLVERVAAAFLKSGGDLPTTYRAVFLSPEFSSEAAYRCKIKSPLEFVASSVRALGGNYASPDGNTPRGRARLLNMGTLSLRPERARRLPYPSLAAELVGMGEPLFSCMPPTGYPEDSRKWVSSSALIARLNFALALTGGQISDVALREDTFKAATVTEASLQLTSGDLSPHTSATLENEVKEAPADGARLRALVLGTPEFQRR